MPFNSDADGDYFQLNCCFCQCMHHVLNVVFHRLNWIYCGVSSLISIIFEKTVSNYLRNSDPVIESHLVSIVPMIWYWLWAARP